MKKLVEKVRKYCMDDDAFYDYLSEKLAKEMLGGIQKEEALAAVVSQECFKLCVHAESFFGFLDDHEFDYNYPGDYCKHRHLVMWACEYRMHDVLVELVNRGASLDVTGSIRGRPVGPIDQILLTGLDADYSEMLEYLYGCGAIPSSPHFVVNMVTQFDPNVRAVLEDHDFFPKKRVLPWKK